jgi:anti-sigma factor RsiW
MFHLNDRVLERLVTGAASGADVDRIRRHVDECRACARRLEEWRDHFVEVDQNFPQLATALTPAATMTAGGLVVIPPSESRRAFPMDLATVLWGLAGVLAVVVGYGLFGLAAAAGDSEELAFRDDSLATVTATRPVVPGSSLPDEPRPPVARSEAPVRPEEPPTEGPGPPPLATSPQFRAVTLGEAAQYLGGALRGVSGLTPDHYEVAPSGIVPGAQRNLEVIRVVYRLGTSGRLTLDQQRIPVDSSGFRPIEDAALESGETVFRTTQDGAASAIWLDEGGYRLALSGRISQDSLRTLLGRVR